MRIENVKRIAEQSEEYSVTAEPALYCDGHLICITNGEMDLSHTRYGQKAADLWASTLSGAGDIPVVVEAEMRGRFPLYVRYLKGGVTVAIAEKYRRCFDDNAEFRAYDRDRQVLVFEKGVMVGIVMPIRTWTESSPIDHYPIIPFVDERALYHRCESVL